MSDRLNMGAGSPPPSLRATSPVLGGGVGPDLSPRRALPLSTGGVPRSGEGVDRRRALIALLAALLLAACGGSGAEDEGGGVTSYLAGQLSIHPRVDSTRDYSGFEVLVARGGVGVDTLGFAVTDTAGVFTMRIRAPERGVYPLLISRGGALLTAAEIVVAEGDTTRLVEQLPTGNRLLRLRSPENAAWLALRNTKAQFNAAVVEQIQGAGYDEGRARNSVLQTARILWGMREMFPATVGSELAAAEAVAMVAGWDDSLAVAWAEALDPAEAGFADAASVARQATARREGPEAALQRMRAFQARATVPEDRARLLQEVVLAFRDLDQPDSALATARRLAADFPETPYARWASRAAYDLENLQPGMPAPDFATTDIDSADLALQALRGRLVLLEFYTPQSAVYLRELPLRRALRATIPADVLEIVSVSVEPDTALSRALLAGRDLAGRHVFLPEGLDAELARRYNVNVVPMRYLIGPEGRILARYAGGAMTTIQQDVLALLRQAGGA